MSRNSLSMNGELKQKDYLMSNNQQWKAVFQKDGIFVIYDWKPVWASDTNGSGATRLVLQADSNLVIYDRHQSPKWASNTNGKGNAPCHLKLSDKGVLKLYKENTKIWESHNR